MFLEAATLALMINVISSTGVCNQSQCVNLSSCPALQKHLANPHRSMLERLNNSICEIKEDVKVCCSNDFDKPPEHKPPSIVINDCGRQDPVSKNPWMAFISFGWSMCSGALLSDRYVLTAASCVSDNNESNKIITLLLGDFNLKNITNCSYVTHEKECINFEQFYIEKAIQHPLHNGTFNNIALIRLDRAVQFSEYIRPICLPTYQPKFFRADDRLFMSGFGVKFVANIQRNLFKTNSTTSLITLEACREWFKKTNEVFLSVFNMCSVDIPDASEGFSSFVNHGGPVMSFYNDQWYVEGLLSVAIDDGSPTRPLIHTNVSYYVDWIYANIHSWD